METYQKSYKLLPFEASYVWLVADWVMPWLHIVIRKKQQRTIFTGFVKLQWGCTKVRASPASTEKTCGFASSLWCHSAATNLRKKFWEHLKGLVRSAWVESFIITLKWLRKAFAFWDGVGAHLPPSSRSAERSTDSCHARVRELPSLAWGRLLACPLCSLQEKQGG